MKKALWIYLPLMILMLACSKESGESSQKDTNTTTTNSATSDKPTTDKSDTPKPDPKPVDEGKGPLATTWKGTLDGKIPVTLDLYRNDRLHVGTLVYDKVGKPIDVIGYQTYEDQIYFKEYAKDGKGSITGMWTFEIKGDEATGTWTASYAEEDKDLPISMKKVGEKRLKESLDMVTPEGNYAYDYPGDGGTGDFDISKVTDDLLEFDLVAVTSAPSYHIAEMEDVQEVIDGNRLFFQEKSGEYMDCAFEILFYRHFILVDYVDERFECGFGARAGCSGIYYKTK